jgi:hypothetical protein
LHVSHWNKYLLNFRIIPPPTDDDDDLLHSEREEEEEEEEDGDGDSGRKGESVLFSLILGHS